MEQIRMKRAGLGLRGHDPSRAYQGYTLFAPNLGDGAVYLIDMHGEVFHSWQMPYSPGQYGYLTERGTLIYNGKVPDSSGRFISKEPWKGGALIAADWQGNILWEVQHPDHHHDGILLRNGNVMLLGLEVLPPEFAARVRGGMAGTEHQGRMYADTLIEMTTAGQVVWEWRIREHLEPEAFPIVASQDRRLEWTHGNSVEELPDGNLLVSYRNISTVAIVERATGDVIWTLGAPPLAQQHAPTLLPNGNLLIFDNGTHRVDHQLPHSRVIEVEIATKRIVWSYQERRLYDFYSPLISNAQRLPNGNTLICEGSFGRFFEVTAGGEVVWEYVNPHVVAMSDRPDLPPGNHVFRAYRYGAEQVAHWASQSPGQS